MSQKFDKDITIEWILGSNNEVKKCMLKLIIDTIVDKTDLQDVKSMCDQRIFSLDSGNEWADEENQQIASGVDENQVSNDVLIKNETHCQTKQPNAAKCCSALIDTLHDDFEQMWSKAKQEIYSFNKCSGVELDKFKKVFDYAIDDIDSDHTFTYKTWYLEAKKHFKSSVRQMNVRSSHTPKLIDDCIKTMNDISNGLDQLSITCDNLIQKSLDDSSQTEISGEILCESFYDN